MGLTQEESQEEVKQGPNPVLGSTILPQHIAVIMDGNGRWAQQKNKARTFGHKAGVNALESVIEGCAKLNIPVLSVFAFSSENWKRPAHEVDVLMSLFLTTLKSQVSSLIKNNIRMNVIGDRSRLSEKLQKKILEVESKTESMTGLHLIVAVNYGGQWDIQQAARQMHQAALEDQVSIDDLELTDFLSMKDVVNPDLFIRTGGEKRISNFFLWQLAYSELYFTETLWPDFDQNELQKAIDCFARRQRRFGLTGEQVEKGEVV